MTDVAVAGAEVTGPTLGHQVEILCLAGPEELGVGTPPRGA